MYRKPARAVTYDFVLRIMIQCGFYKDKSQAIIRKLLTFKHLYHLLTSVVSQGRAHIEMPNSQAIHVGVSELPQGRPLVVALVGATTGIGSYVAKTWATTFAKHGSKLRVYIVGRNAARAEVLLNLGRETSPGSDWHFVKVSDLSLMQEVDRVSNLIIQQEEESPFAGGPARLDALYLSQARSPLHEAKSMFPS